MLQIQFNMECSLLFTDKTVCYRNVIGVILCNFAAGDFINSKCTEMDGGIEHMRGDNDDNIEWNMLETKLDVL